VPRRPRGEKKPIPDEQKDRRYFERRKRNNLAAKKSRDQRKVREDTVSVRAEALEKENAVLRVQVKIWLIPSTCLLLTDSTTGLDSARGDDLAAGTPVEEDAQPAAEEEGAHGPQGKTGSAQGPG
jgi:hypothetical protein